MKTQIVTTDRLTMLVEERKNLTTQVREVVDQISAEIEELCIPGYKIEVENVGTLELMMYDGSKYLTIDGGQNGWDFPIRYMFNHVEPLGVEVGHTEDYVFRVAKRQHYLLFANNIEKIVKAYEEHENTLLDALKTAINHMQIVAEQ